jgi:hypothetical protein
VNGVAREKQILISSVNLPFLGTILGESTGRVLRIKIGMLAAKMTLKAADSGPRRQ